MTKDQGTLGIKRAWNQTQGYLLCVVTRIYSFIFSSLWNVITKYNKYYYQMRLLFYYKKYDKSLLLDASGFLLQNAAILLQGRVFVTKCGSFVSKCDIYHKS